MNTCHRIAVLLLLSTFSLSAQVTLGGTLVPKDRIIVYLFVGHSNMCSSGPERYTQIHANTWNYRIDDGNHRWEHAQDPVHDAGCWGGSNGGPATQFLKAMQDAYPGYHFGVLQNADKASSVSRTSSCSGKRYGVGGALTAELVNAALEIKDKVTLGGIFINLGIMERDWTPDRDEFASNVAAMVEDIRARLGIADIPVLMQQYEMGARGSFSPTSTGAKKIISQIHGLPSLLSNCAVVPTDWSTQSGMMQDDHHFSKRGHARLATELQSVIRSAGLDAWQGPTDTEPPIAPANLQAEVSGTTISLSWNAAEDNSGSIATYVAYSDAAELARFPGTSTTGSITGLAPQTSYALSLTAVDGAGNESDPSGQVTVTTGEGVSAGLPLFVNCGGTTGGGYLADQAWDGVWGYEVRENDVTVSNDVAGTDNDHMYNSVAHKSFRYRVAVSPGTYAVTLHFCEHWLDAAGSRVFTILLNGKPAPVDPIDILDHVAKRAAYDVSAVVSVTGNSLTIESQAIIGGPILNGITVESASQVPVVAPDISPEGGEVQSAHTTVSITSETGDAAIYYTTDGSEPNPASSAALNSTGNFTLYLDYGQSKVVKAIACVEGMMPSAVAEATFSRPAPTNAVTLLSPNGDRDYSVGDTMHIRWDADTTVLTMASVLITFDEGENWLTLNTESITPGDPLYGNFPWVIPHTFGGTTTASELVLVRVQNYEAVDGVVDRSDSTFSIVSSATVARSAQPRSSTAGISVVPARDGVRVIVTDAYTPSSIALVRLDGSRVRQWRLEPHDGTQSLLVRASTIGAGTYLIGNVSHGGITGWHMVRLH